MYPNMPIVMSLPSETRPNSLLYPGICTNKKALCAIS
jgi:hypothetical protein